MLNPGSAIGPDGSLYLFPRLVADGNVSRIGRARVIVDGGGLPIAVERLGVVLEPDESWEQHAFGGGVEDPRITEVPSLVEYVMAYTAYGPLGPRVALAVSSDLVRSERLRHGRLQGSGWPTSDGRAEGGCGSTAGCV